jgi:hypothetical protein
MKEGEGSCMSPLSHKKMVSGIKKRVVFGENTVGQFVREVYFGGFFLFVYY